MSAHYVLKVIRAENIVLFSEPKLTSKAKNLYVKVSFGTDAKKTQIQDGIAPVWGEPLTISLEASTSRDLTVELKQRSTFRRRTCIGSAEISLQELLNRSARGEVRLDLLHPGDIGPSTLIGVVFLHLKLVTETERTRIDINTAVEGVNQSGIANPARTERFDTVDGTVTLLSSQSDLAKSLASILAKMDVFVGIIDKLSTIHPYLSAAWQVTSSLYKAIRNQVQTDQKFVDMVHMMEDIFNLISDVEFIRDRIKSLERPICQFLQQSTECCTFVKQYVHHGFAVRTFDTTSGTRIDGFMARFRDLKAALDSGIGLQTTFISARMSEKIDTIYLRQELNPSDMDAFSRKQCLSGTRVEILEEIMDWLFSESDENIFWLRGVAGSGKSTVSMTISEYCLSMQRRGAYLFFEREKSDPSSVIRNIAFWLASFDQFIATRVIEAIRGHNGIAKASISMQFDKLLFEPLRATADAVNGPVIIVLDALDECGTRDARKTLLELLKTRFKELPGNFRFLITSRPEPDIYQTLLSSPSIHAVELDYSSQSSRDDATRYISQEMREIFESARLEVPSNWDDSIALLGNTANGLFVWASTAVKMVSTSDSPSDDFEDLLSYCHSVDLEPCLNKNLVLSSLYDTVLRDSGIRWTRDRSRLRFIQIVSLILFSKRPLSVAEIDGILGLSEDKSSSLIIERLQSVLLYTPGNRSTPVRILHASFSDYLTAPERNKEKWFIDVSAQRSFIAIRCFDVMEKGLRFNICGLESSFISNVDVPGIETSIRDRIPSSLEYACRFWVEHLCDVPYSTDLADKLTIFAEQYLLYWFEVLSLTKHFRRVASRALYNATSWSPNHPNDISSFLWDAYRLCNIFWLPMSESVPHIYLSALSIAKDESTVADHYSTMHPVIQVHKLGTKPPQPCMKVFKGHTKLVNSVAFSPDGKRVVSGSGDGTIRVWDAESGQIVARLFEEHTRFVNSVGFSPDGKRVVSGSFVGTICVWDAETGQIVAGPFEGHTSLVFSVGFSLDGKRVVSGSRDGTIRVWDAETGQIVAGPFEGHTGDVNSVGFSPDGKRVVSGSGDKTIRVWDAENGQVDTGPFKGHTNSVSSVTFSPDGKRVVSGSDDRTIRVWDVESGQVVAGPFQGHAESVYSVGFSPDGKRVVSGSLDQTIRVWDADSGQVVAGPFEGEIGSVHSVAFSPDGKRVVSGSSDETIRVWDAESGQVIAGTFEGHTSDVNSVGFSPDGKRVVSGSDDKTIRVWDAETGQIDAGPFEGHTKQVNSVGFSPDGERVVSGSLDKTIRVWDTGSGEVVAGPFQGHTNSVYSVAFSPDGKRVVSGSADETIRVWDAESGQVIAGPFEGHTDSVKSVAFSPDGKRVVSGSHDENIRVWDAETGQVVAGPFKRHTWSVDSVGFSPDGKRVVSGSGDGMICVCDADSGQVVAGPFEGHALSVYSVGFSPDGKRIVSGSSDGTICVWDSESGEVVAGPFEGHTSLVFSVGFSADGKRVVSSSKDRTIRVWDVTHASAETTLHHSEIRSDTDGIHAASSGSSFRVEMKRKEMRTRTFLGELGLPFSWKWSDGKRSDEERSDGEWSDGEWSDGERSDAERSDGERVDNGWLLGKGGELLLWIPEDMRKTLWAPSNTAVFSCQFSTKLDFSGSKVGPGWYEVYKSRAEK